MPEQGNRGVVVGAYDRVIALFLMPRKEALKAVGQRAIVVEDVRLLLSERQEGVGAVSVSPLCFRKAGDVALNIHSIAGTVTSFDTEKKTFTVNYCKKEPDGVLSPRWRKAATSYGFSTLTP